MEWGQVDDPRDQYSEGDVLSISCNHGYELQGEAEIKCLASGDWENHVPVCKRKYQEITRSLSLIII